MAIKREKWEDRYDQIKNMPELPTNETLEEELKGKEVQFAQRLAQIKDTSSQEYREVVSERNAVRREYENSMKENDFLRENFVAIKSNLSLIEKARENRNTYQEILDEILESKAENEKRIEEIDKLRKEAERLETELSELKYHEEHLLIAVNNQEATPEQRAQAASRLENIRKKLSKNHFDFSDNQNALEEQLKTPPIDIVDGDIEELQSKIDRSNRTCELLLEGKSMSEVQTALGEAKKSKSQKIAEPKETVKPVEPKTPEPKKTVQPTSAPKAQEPEKAAQPTSAPKTPEKPVEELKPQEPEKKEVVKQPKEEKTAEQPVQENVVEKPKTEEAKKTITIDEIANRIFKILNAEDKKSITENRYTFINRLQDGHEKWYNYLIKLPYNAIKSVEDKVYEMCSREQSQEKQPESKMPVLQPTQEKAQAPKLAEPAQKTPQSAPTPKAAVQQPTEKMPILQQPEKKSDEAKSNKLSPEQIRWTSIFVGKNGSAMEIETSAQSDIIKREYTALTKKLQYVNTDGIDTEMIDKARKIGDPMIVREILCNDKLSSEAKKGLLHYYTKMIQLRKEDPDADIEKYARVLDLQYDVRGLRKSGLSKKDQQKVLRKAKEAKDLGIAEVKTNWWTAAKWAVEDFAESIGFRVWDSQTALEAPKEEQKPTTAERKSKKDMDSKYRVDTQVLDAEYEPVEAKTKKKQPKSQEVVNDEVEDPFSRF